MLFRAGKKFSREVSIYDPIGTDKDGETVSLMDILETEGKEAIEQIILKQEVKDLYAAYEKELKETEKAVIRMRYGLFGSREHTQREVAKQLGIKYYDKDIIAQIAEQSGFSAEYIEEKAELSPKKGLLAYAFAGRDITGKSVEDMVYEAQRKVILEIAEKESCVIIGRNADFILKDKDNVLNVFIHGDMPEKVARICKLYNVTEEEAEKMMADIDKRRMTNYRFYTDQKWGMAKNYI